MKTLRFLLFLLTAGMLFMGCQKELSEENARALGDLPKDAAGNCQSPVINGNYVVGVPLSPATESIALQLNITQVGVYSLVTDTVNGYYFSGIGVTGVTGVNTVRLEARGTPLVAGTDVFTVKFNGAICQINNIVTATPGGGGGGGGTAAVFTLGSTAGVCTSTPAGVYAQNFPTSTTTNYVDVGVSVTTAGTYSVSSAVVNGVKFSGIGNLTTTSTTIRLYADGGTPTAAGIINYPLTVGASNCSFNITYLPPPAIANLNLNCGAATVSGPFQAGGLISPTHKITISGIVTASGVYNISTNTVNGVRFVGSGSLTASPTAQTIDLFAVPVGASGNYGTAVGPQTYNIQSPFIIGTGTNCTTGVVVNFTPATATGTIRARIGSVTAPFTNFNVNISTTNLGGINFSGESGTGMESIDIGVVNATTVGVGTYTVNQLTSGILVNCDYDTNAGVTFSAQSALTPQPVLPFTITFTTITSTGATGTFSGNVFDGATPKTIFNGEFTITF
jgi:hypothetical protein